MPTLFRLAYAIVVALMLILFVILGIRTVYPEPESPWANGVAGPALPSSQEISAYESRQVRYERNVLIAATLLGAVAVVGGLYVFRQVAPLGLGLALGGLGVVSYGWAQAGDRFDQIGPAAPFLAAGIGLAALAAGGWLFIRPEPVGRDDASGPSAG